MPSRASGPSFGTTIAHTYSATLGTSVVVGYQREKYNAEVVTIGSDVGQQVALEAARKESLACQAVASPRVGTSAMRAVSG